MKYVIVNETNPRAMRLQSIGNVLGTPASEVKKGDFLMWNFGSKSEVIDIINETKSFITAKMRSEGGYEGERKLKKTRLVCILEK